MPTRTAEATWNGDLFKGKGNVKLGSGAYSGPYSFQSRFESGAGTNPEELIGAAHAGCYSMALAAGLSKAGKVPTSVHTTAKVHIDKQGDGFAITSIDLDCEAVVPNIDNAEFQKAAEATKSGCPVSKALSATKINLKATLKNA